MWKMKKILHQHTYLLVGLLFLLLLFLLLVGAILTSTHVRDIPSVPGYHNPPLYSMRILDHTPIRMSYRK